MSLFNVDFIDDSFFANFLSDDLWSEISFFFSIVSGNWVMNKRALNWDSRPWDSRIPPKLFFLRIECRAKYCA